MGMECLRHEVVVGYLQDKVGAGCLREVDVGCLREEVDMGFLQENVGVGYRTVGVGYLHEVAVGCLQEDVEVTSRVVEGWRRLHNLAAMQLVEKVDADAVCLQE